ncbi:hypothetical protein ACHAXA_005860 [Cyclostephanos tholiformis]|uniref:Uncharacterized protein n=1 Tax=Cyclostephanos tholiformis TaxID=382380 RepID=A0ABD3RCW4_9STRA
MVESNVPLLAMPSGSILQFLLMTVPLLCVYLYFLFLAYERPSIADPDNPRYEDDRIRLTDILYTYLATLVPFSSLVVYMLWFVPMRRGLSRRYESDAIIILGDVKYTESYYDRSRILNADEGGIGNADRASRVVRNCLHRLCGWMTNGFALRNNYAYVVYDLERVANHPACDYEERGGESLSGIITKRVRVYHRYPRERVSILVLPEYPYSGQPKMDMEADWASFAGCVRTPSREGEGGGGGGGEEDVIIPKRDRGLGVLAVATFWICFLVLASYYVADRIEVIDDAYDDEDAVAAWRAFKIVLGGVVPGVAIGGNWIRWKIHERWMLHSGSKEKSERTGKNDEVERREEEGGGGGGSYIQMS